MLKEYVWYYQLTHYIVLVLMIFCFFYLGSALIQIPGLILSIFDYLKGMKFVRMASKRVHTKDANDSVTMEQVEKQARAPMQGNTDASKITFGIKEQNILMNIEQRFRSLEDKIGNLNVENRLESLEVAISKLTLIVGEIHNLAK